MDTAITTAQRTAFYKAAVVGLRALDARETAPRRLGVDADARWEQFSGALDACDRLDILLRDAAGQWGVAFSPSECFGFFGLSSDEPFGPDWQGIEASAAKRLLNEIGDASTLDQVTSALSLTSALVELPPLTPASKLVVAGAGAVVAVVKAFSDNRALSWTDQVVVVAAIPALRQLAGLGAVMLGARGRTVLVRPTEDAEGVMRAKGFAHLDAAVVSPDAESDCAEFARKVVGK